MCMCFFFSILYYNRYIEIMGARPLGERARPRGYIYIFIIIIIVINVCIYIYIVYIYIYIYIYPLREGSS